ncbi:peritrophin-48-like [Drosophila subobscura]|uniref:peritrophin-48-like n=1 Tax=Drosophila subobscura TaxID=7241 RepID=UPI00155A46CB|nr:peritrophin-48-like [Drosophila subobscura]
MAPTFQLLLLLVVQCLVGALAVNPFDVGARAASNPCQDVRVAGFICVDCATLGYCLHDGNGQWETQTMMTCQSDHSFYCTDEGTFGCTWQSKCRVPVRGKFYCQQPGMFPDPYDCRNYHECSTQNVDTPRQCGNGAAYSTLTDSCTLPKDSDQCSAAQYTCSRAGQTGAWPADSRFYYICQKDTAAAAFFPLLMRCSEGYVFNGYSCVTPTKKLASSRMLGSRSCTNYAISTCPGATASDEYCLCIDGALQTQHCPDGSYFDAQRLVCHQGTLVDPSETPSNSGSTPGGSCQRVGMVGDLANCSTFYHCDAVGATMKQSQCPAGTIFSLTKFVCEAGSC